MKQTLIVTVEDKPGVLNRVASLFRRRNFNIESLAVGHSETPGISRMTIVTDEEDMLRRSIIRSNLVKLVNVIDVQDVTETPCLIRETALIKVGVEAPGRREVMDLAEMYRARIVDVANNALIVEVTGETSKINALLEVLEPVGILEVMRTGQVAMTRGTSAPRQTSSEPVHTLNGAHWRGE